MNHSIMSLDRDNKTKLLPATFPYILGLLWEKINFSLKRVIVITVIISLHYKETVLFALLLQ